METFNRSCWCDDDDDDDVIVFVVVSLVCLLRYYLPRFRVSSSSTLEERVSAHVRTAVPAAEEEEEEDFVSPFSPLKRLESDLNADLTEFVTFKCR